MNPYNHPTAAAPSWQEALWAATLGALYGEPWAEGDLRDLAEKVYRGECRPSIRSEAWETRQCPHPGIYGGPRARAFFFAEDLPAVVVEARDEDPWLGGYRLLVYTEDENLWRDDPPPLPEPARTWVGAAIAALEAANKENHPPPPPRE
jgi:hypothetical protein